MTSMSTTTIFTGWPALPSGGGIRFGRETPPARSAAQGSAAGDPCAVDWVLERGGALAPRPVRWLLAGAGALALGIAGLLRLRGAELVMPLAGIELLALAAVMLLALRHATDCERIALHDDRLTVERLSGRRSFRVVFRPAWVRVEPRYGDRSLIELSGQGRRITVGRFVRPELRSQLAEELRWALRRWQQRAVH